MTDEGNLRGERTRRSLVRCCDCGGILDRIVAQPGVTLTPENLPPTQCRRCAEADLERIVAGFMENLDGTPGRPFACGGVVA